MVNWLYAYWVGCKLWLAFRVRRLRAEVYVWWVGLKLWLAFRARRLREWGVSL